MRRRELSDKLIAALKPRAATYRVFDGDGSGLHVAVKPSGTRVFALQYRIGGARRFYTLGLYEQGMTLAQARVARQAARDLVARGIDPRQQAQRQREAEERRSAAEEAKRLAEHARGTFADLVAGYTDAMKADGKKTHAEVRRALEREAMPIIGADTKARDVTKAQIQHVLHEILARGAEVYANRVRSYLAAAFKFATDHDNHPRNFGKVAVFNVDSNPVLSVPRPRKKEAPGDRALSEEELREFWAALDSWNADIRITIAVRLILLFGGSRVKEITNASWSEFDVDRALWDLPQARSKSGRANVLPITRQALEALESLRAVTGDGALLFPNLRSKGKTPTMPVSSVNRAIRRWCWPTEGTKKDPGPRFALFTTRDLRRTAKTRMGELGIGKEIRDRIQNHALQDVSSRHYDRFEYVPQKRAALESWCDWLTASAKKNRKVVAIRRR